MFKVDTDTDGGRYTLVIKGEVDEFSQFPSIPENVNGKVYLNLKSIETFNSLGVRSWVKWVNSFRSDLTIVFVEVPPNVIEYMNMISNFLPKNHIVESFYVPFEREDGTHVQLYLLEQGKGLEGTNVILPGKVIDDQTGETLELAVVPNKYFSFLNSSK